MMFADDTNVTYAADTIADFEIVVKLGANKA